MDEIIAFIDKKEKVEKKEKIDEEKVKEKKEEEL